MLLSSVNSFQILRSNSQSASEVLGRLLTLKNPRDVDFNMFYWIIQVQDNASYIVHEHEIQKSVSFVILRYTLLYDMNTMMPRRVRAKFNFDL